MKKKMKKRIIILIISIIFVLFIGMYVMIFFDNRYINNVKDVVSKNTNIKNIAYVNNYDDNYIVVNNEYLYLINSNYEEITRVDLSLMYDNKNDYDIVYKDKTIMYMKDFKNKDGVIFEYYDIYTGELIEKIVIGGN